VNAPTLQVTLGREVDEQARWLASKFQGVRHADCDELVRRVYGKPVLRGRVDELPQNGGQGGCAGIGDLRRETPE